ncbi:hypothetical protein PC120_g10579 [Phytophthora cactorum]|nr:hypothetical protein PC120_g10579 [Phytophthora cactorum]
MEASARDSRHHLGLQAETHPLRIVAPYLEVGQLGDTQLHWNFLGSESGESNGTALGEKSDAVDERVRPYAASSDTSSASDGKTKSELPSCKGSEAGSRSIGNSAQ